MDIYIKGHYQRSIYQNSNDWKNQSRLDIALRKHEFEETLNKMWKIYSQGNVQQIVAYNKQIAEIKRYGYKVMRNSAGNHKLILIKE